MKINFFHLIFRILNLFGTFPTILNTLEPSKTLQHTKMNFSTTEISSITPWITLNLLRTPRTLHFELWTFFFIFHHKFSFTNPHKSTISHLLLSQRLKIRRILGISLPARRTKLILVGTNSMPAEATNLIATGAGIKAQVVDLEGFHAEWTFGQVITAGIHHVHDDLHAKLFSIKNTKHTFERLLC